MSGAREPRGAFMIWRVLLLAQIREQPARLLVTVLAIALGVALGAAVYLVNNAALNEFGLATKRLVGEADVVVRGPHEGFPEPLFALLSGDAAVRVASPVLELDVALPGRRDTLKVLGLDPFRAATLQPALIGDIGGGVLALLQPDSIYISAAVRHSNCSCAQAIRCRSSSAARPRRCACSVFWRKVPIRRRSGSWISPPRNGRSIKSAG